MEVEARAIGEQGRYRCWIWRRTHRGTKDANDSSRVATPMSIPFICRTATTQDAAASPSVAVSAAAVAAVLVLVVSPNPDRGQIALVAPFGHPVEDRVVAHHELQTAVVCGVGVVYDAICQSKGARARSFR
jgi:hypothetical protein